MKDNWISVQDKLPLEEYRGEGVIDDFLVTVELDNPDPCDDREVMTLWFDARKQIWFNFETWEEYNHGWHVVAWMEKPKPAT